MLQYLLFTLWALMLVCFLIGAIRIPFKRAPKNRKWMYETYKVAGYSTYEALFHTSGLAEKFANWGAGWRQAYWKDRFLIRWWTGVAILVFIGWLVHNARAVQ